MEVKGKVVVVTGGASGIGKALCERFMAEGAKAVVVADRDAAGAQATAAAIGATAQVVDVTDEAAVRALVQLATERFGQVDVFCSNAGIIRLGDEDVDNVEWQRHWDINVMAHVYAARAVLPQMLARGAGYLLQTVSAAGLLSQVDAAPYSVTKHAALGFAEWLSIAHGAQGIRVGCLCPQGVLTPMLQEAQPQAGQVGFLTDGALSPEQVAQAVIDGMRDERFLILPHAEVLGFLQRKTSDYDRWLGGMRKLRAKVVAPASRP